MKSLKLRLRQRQIRMLGERGSVKLMQMVGTRLDDYNYRIGIYQYCLCHNSRPSNLTFCAPLQLQLFTVIAQTACIFHDNHVHQIILLFKYCNLVCILPYMLAFQRCISGFNSILLVAFPNKTNFKVRGMLNHTFSTRHFYT